MPIKLGHIEIFVRDVERSREFYEDGFGCSLVTIQGGGQFAWLQSGTVEILLRQSSFIAAKPDIAYGQAGPPIVFYTEDLSGDLTRLAGLGIRPNGCDGDLCCPTFTDPDGHSVQLVDPSFDSV
jgi:catechol 2,3-dioxygenase-like lactoylglutathione lyase family enzyme